MAHAAIVRFIVPFSRESVGFYLQSRTKVSGLTALFRVQHSA